MSRVRWLLALVLFGPMSWLGASEPESIRDLLTVQIGDCPVIVTAPHGGKRAIPNVPERRGDGVAKFVAVRDDHTAELAEKLASELSRREFGRPHLIVAKFARKFADVNRPAEDAFETDEAQPYYDAYHAAIKQACVTVQKQFGQGLLLDIHGQAPEPDAIFRGTNNGRSVTLLRERFGEEALAGPKSLFGLLGAQGHRVIPPVSSSDKEDLRFNGGYTVQTYGSHNGTAIDAIQLEFGGKFRAPDQLVRTTTDIAEAVIRFSREHPPQRRRDPWPGPE